MNFIIFFCLSRMIKRKPTLLKPNKNDIETEWQAKRREINSMVKYTVYIFCELFKNHFDESFIRFFFHVLFPWTFWWKFYTIFFDVLFPWTFCYEFFPCSLFVYFFINLFNELFYEPFQLNFFMNLFSELFYEPFQWTILWTFSMNFFVNNFQDTQPKFKKSEKDKIHERIGLKQPSSSELLESPTL
mgnify:CR=1 FL=1